MLPTRPQWYNAAALAPAFAGSAAILVVILAERLPAVAAVLAALTIGMCLGVAWFAAHRYSNFYSVEFLSTDRL